MHQLCQHFGTPHYRQPVRSRRKKFGVVLFNSRGDDHNLGGAQILCVMPDGDAHALLAEPLDVGALGLVGALHCIAQVYHDLGDTANLPVNLVRYATLAASSHNTQPWRFRLSPGGMAILPDMSRRCPEVDPDDHHLYASLGSAAENLLLAAQAAGLHANCAPDPATSGLR